MNRTKIKAPLWQKVTSSIVTGVLLSQISLPVFAAVKFSIAMEELNDAIQNSGRYYELTHGSHNYLYAGRLESEELGILDGFQHFFHQLKEQRPDLIPGYNPSSKTAPTIDEMKPRFGSPYVERGIIRDQITQIINKSWISRDGYSSENDQNKALYENAVSVAKQYGFKLGQPLSETQIAAINVDIIWPELRTINDIQYLVPFVYLAQSTVNEQRITDSSFIAGSAEINTNTFSINGANVIFKHKSLLDVENDFINTQGYLEGKEITIRVGRELQNLSGTITGDDVTLIAKHLENSTLVTRTDYAHGYAEAFQQIGTISSLGDLNIFTSGDVTSHGGNFSAQGDLKINAGGNIILVPQTAKNERAESGDMWSDSESSLVNLQTNLSAVDTLSLIAGGAVHIEGAILESQGLLEILSGYGITLKSAADLKSFEKKFEASSGGVFGTTETYEESKTEAEIVRTLLKAGQSMVLKTTQGNILLEAVTVDNKGLSNLIAENGSIDFTLATLIEQYSYKHSSEGALAFRHQGHGYNREIAYYTEFIQNGGLMLDATNGINIQYAGEKGETLNQTIDRLSAMPELAWMGDIRNNPAVQAQWEELQLIHETWDYDQSGLTGPAMAVIMVAMAMMTGGTSLAALGPMKAAMAAGLNAIQTQLVVGLLANGGDLGKTLKDVTSSDSLRSIATSMVTAGVMSHINAEFFAASTDAAGNAIPSKLEQLYGFAPKSLEFQVIQRLTQATATTSLNSIANGHSFDEFGDALVQSVATSAVYMLGEKLANEIGEASRPGKDNNGQITEPDIGLVTKYIAHAGLGCGMGAALASLEGNSDSVKDGCYSGAGGGVIGEYVAETYKEKMGLIERESEEFAEGVINDLKDKNPTLSKNELFERYQLEMLELRRQGVNISKLVAGLSVYALGGDINTAITTGGNAAQHNAWFILPILWAAAKAVMTAMAVNEAIKTVKEINDFLNNPNGLTEAQINEKIKAAIVALAVELGIGRVTKAIPADKLIELVEEIKIKLAQIDLPGSKYVLAELNHLSISAQPDGTGSSKLSIGSSSSSAFHPKPSGMSEADYGEYLKHLDVAPSAKITPESFLERSKTQYYDPDRGWINKDFDVTINRASPTIVEKTDALKPTDRIKIKGIRGGEDSTISVAEAEKARYELIKRRDAGETHLNKDINNYSEALGELRSRKYAQEANLGTELANKPANSNQSNFVFDQVYVDGNGKVTILEAKGSVSSSPSLSGHRIGNDKHLQGTQKYFDSMMANMKEVVGKLSPDDPYRDTYKAIMRAKDSGNISYKMVVQTISPNNGALGEAVIKTYDIK
ncbi:DUF637 domain-containing protein [Grimontia kaedaensis]|uniref:DUF637 domain-containing protein n=1 Tax=Grimontia kaedaensis TaxID=2872157 RepID=A0ABY4WXM9_9GAMM|nr:DUF637 domain-containing protein [Grimontia kaedaensis]USH03734.1 DUF637 domain-containing protein [Grimontia kaedaensis]